MTDCHRARCPGSDHSAGGAGTRRWAADSRPARTGPARGPGADRIGTVRRPRAGTGGVRRNRVRDMAAALRRGRTGAENSRSVDTDRVGTPPVDTDPAGMPPAGIDRADTDPVGTTGTDRAGRTPVEDLSVDNRRRGSRSGDIHPFGTDRVGRRSARTPPVAGADRSTGTSGAPRTGSGRTRRHRDNCRPGRLDPGAYPVVDAMIPRCPRARRRAPPTPVTPPLWAGVGRSARRRTRQSCGTRYPRRAVCRIIGTMTR